MGRRALSLLCLRRRANRQAEQALAVDPHQRTALGLLGMAAFEQQQYRAAMQYWQRLLAMEPIESESARMISVVIETARQRLAEQDPSDVASSGVTASQEVIAPSVGITVHVALSPDVEISAADTVFILARNADAGSRMPIAVQRLTRAQLPVTHGLLVFVEKHPLSR